MVNTKCTPMKIYFFDRCRHYVRYAAPENNIICITLVGDYDTCTLRWPIRNYRKYPWREWRSEGRNPKTVAAADHHVMPAARATFNRAGRPHYQLLLLRLDLLVFYVNTDTRPYHRLHVKIVVVYPRDGHTIPYICVKSTIIFVYK